MGTPGLEEKDQVPQQILTRVVVILTKIRSLCFLQ